MDMILLTYSVNVVMISVIAKLWHYTNSHIYSIMRSIIVTVL